MRSLTMAGALLVLVGCGGSGGDDRAGPGSVVVPALIGRSGLEAHCALVGVGLRWRTGGERVVNSRVVGVAPAGRPIDLCAPHRSYGSGAEEHVLDQYPKAGARVPRGAVVQLEDACTLMPACL